MRIRSITYFIHPRYPISENLLQKAGIFARQAKEVFVQDGYPVQSVRLATPPFPTFLEREDYRLAVNRIEIMAHGEGFEYASLGTALTDQIDSYGAIPEMLAHSSKLFFGGHLTTQSGEICLPAVRACAEVICGAATLEAGGFANLRFAALANVPPWVPFFPAAYHQGKAPAFGLAIEAADLAVDAFSEANSMKDAQDRLVQSIEAHARQIESLGNQLAKTYQVEFKGIDFSLAPFPVQEISIAAALEQLGLEKLGFSGSLAATTFLMSCLDRAKFTRTGFNGLMLPVLEDPVLAMRGAEGVLGIKDLLLYSAICGTGLDTVPLPDDASVDQIQAVLLDIAALSLRLNKPLTARLMPIPGKNAGDETGFNFEFFAPGKVLSLPANPLRGLLTGQENIHILSRLTG